MAEDRDPGRLSASLSLRGPGADDSAGRGRGRAGGAAPTLIGIQAPLRDSERSNSTALRAHLLVWSPHPRRRRGVVAAVTARSQGRGLNHS